jgi:hypothetical protein
LKQLGAEGLTKEQKTEIENNIEQTKTKIREQINGKKQATAPKTALAKTDVKTEYKKRIEATTRPIEIQLNEINISLRSNAIILKSLGLVGKVSDFKFTTEDKSKAFVKLQVDISNEEISTRLKASNFNFNLVTQQA